MKNSYDMLAGIEEREKISANEADKILSLRTMFAASSDVAMDFLHCMKGWTKYALGKAGRLHWLWNLC